MSAKSQKIKETIKEFCLDTTAHGFANIVKTDLIIIKLFWSVIVIVAFNYCAYRINIYFKKFFKLFNLIFTLSYISVNFRFFTI
jgi:hypothetical protein